MTKKHDLSFFYERLPPNIKEEVSRETIDLFLKYFTLIEKYKKSISMISYQNIDDFISRHLFDSYQLTYIIPKNHAVLDLGSGAGFPSVILSILGFKVNAIESNFKKFFFLTETVRELGLSMNVFNERIELFQKKHKIITSRALSSLKNILGIVGNVSHETSHLYFMKGKQAQMEINEAEKAWTFKNEIIKIKTHEEGQIVHIWNWNKK